jgi:hypothetical protein
MNKNLMSIDRYFIQVRAGCIHNILMNVQMLSVRMVKEHLGLEISKSNVGYWQKALCSNDGILVDAIVVFIVKIGLHHKIDQFYFPKKI